MKSLRFRPLILCCSLALLAPACHVYDENLLDGAYADVQDVQALPDVGDEDAGMVDDDVPVIEEDVQIDTGPNCNAFVADGAACIAPYSGQSASVDDLRMPGPQALLVTLGQQILVGDIGTGRVMSFPVAGTDGGVGRRLIGTGIQGTPRPAPTGTDGGMPDATSAIDSGAMEAGTTDGGASDARTDARMDATTDGAREGGMVDGGTRDSGPPPVTARTQALNAPAALETLPNGDTVIADSANHALYVYHPATDTIAPFGTRTFTYGPVALRRLDADTLLVSGDNQIFAMTITGSVPGAYTPIIGQSCGMSCRGFTSATTAGTDAMVNLPTGIDFDDNYIYFADSMNCRVRRASRMSGNFQVDTLAGNGCNRDIDLSGASTGQLLAANASLGPIGDVKVSLTGLVVFTDALYRCAIFAANPADGKLSLIAGRTDNCSTTTGDFHGAILGQLGQLAFAPDKFHLYYVDKTAEKIGLINLSNPAAPSAPTFPVDPGIIPAMDEDAATVRTGGVSGVAVVNDDTSLRVFWGDLAARRVYFGVTDAPTPFAPPRTNTAAGTGALALNAALSSQFMEPFEPIGLGEIPDPNAVHRIFVGMPDHDIIAMMTTLPNAQGRLQLARPAGTYDTPPPPVAQNTPTFTGPANMDTVLGPQWPIAVGTALNDLLFTTDEPGRVILVPGAGLLTNPTPRSMVLIAGPAAGQTGNTVAQNATIAPLMARLNHPTALAFNSQASGPGAGDYYVSGTGDHVIYRITTRPELSVLAGIITQTTPVSDAMHPANATALITPMGLAYDVDHNRLYVADADANRIRMIDLNANPPTMVNLAGRDPADPFDYTPTGDFGLASQAVIAHPVALYYNAGLLYVGEGYSGRVRVIHLP